MDDLSNLYKEAINNIASELKIKLKELNEKTGVTSVMPTTPTDLTDFSSHSRSRMKSCQISSPHKQGTIDSERIQLPLQSRIQSASNYSCKIIEQLYQKQNKVAQAMGRRDTEESGQSLARSVKVFQQRDHGRAGLRARLSPTN